MLTTDKYHKILLPLLLLSIFANAQVLHLRFDHLTVNNGLPHNAVLSIAQDKYGFMWFGTWGGAVRFDGFNCKTFRADESNPSALPDNRLLAIVKDTNQDIWIQASNPQYLYKYNYASESFSKYRTKEAPVSVVDLVKEQLKSRLHSVQNEMYQWSVNSQGLVETNKATGKKNLYQTNNNNVFALSDNNINCIFLDEFNNLWVGTQNGGVNHANINTKPFAYYYAQASGCGLIDNKVRAVCKDKSGRIWVGSEDKGLTIITHNGGKTYSYIGAEALPNLSVRSIFCDKVGNVLVGTKAGLVVFSGGQHTFLSAQNVFSIKEDFVGNLWVGTSDGLARYNHSNQTLIYLEKKIHKGSNIRALLEDKQKNLWVASEDSGLTKWTPLTGSPANVTFGKCRYVHKNDNDNSLICNRVFSLTEDNEGFIWIATSSGLNRLNPRTNAFQLFTIKNGLADDIIMAVLFDGKQHVWFSHKKGLSRISTKTFEVQNYNMLDGIQGNEFKEACFRDSQTGEMFFGGINGLNSFFPDSITNNPVKPQVVLTGLTVMNQLIQPTEKQKDETILLQSLLCTKKITLRWSDKTFGIEFVALHFANPLECKYKYQLQGYDKQWISTDASGRVASYSNVPSGEYIFKVFATNNDGVWTIIPATLRITILPPWWLTWWAKTIFTLFIIGLAYTIYRIVIVRGKYMLQIKSLHERFSKVSKVDVQNIIINVTDEAFLKKVTQLVVENIENENFDVEALTDKLKLSRTQFYRKIKVLTNNTPHDFVMAIRMQYALKYLLSGEYNVAETAFKVGYTLPTNFTRAFAKFYGTTPMKYVEKLKKDQQSNSDKN